MVIDGTLTCRLSPGTFICLRTNIASILDTMFKKLFTPQVHTGIDGVYLMTTGRLEWLGQQ